MPNRTWAAFSTAVVIVVVIFLFGVGPIAFEFLFDGLVLEFIVISISAILLLSVILFVMGSKANRVPFF